MKRGIFTIAALAVLMLSGCNHGEETTTPVQPTGNDGIYSPARKLSTVIEPGNEAQIWFWENDCVVKIAESDNCGGYTDLADLTYADKRLQSLQTTYDGMSVSAKYTYQDGWLKTVSMQNMGMMLATFDFDKALYEGKLHNIDITLNPMLLELFANMIGGGGELFAKGEQKFMFNDSDISLGLEWDGENVSRTFLKARLEASITIGDLREMFDLDELLGGYAALLGLFSDDTELPLEIEYADTTSRHFDTHPNPMYGFLSQPDVAVLCKNNVLDYSSTGSATLTFTFSTPMGDYPFSFPYPLEERSGSYTYEYDEQGWPTEVQEDDEVVREYYYE